MELPGRGKRETTEKINGFRKNGMQWFGVTKEDGRDKVRWIESDRIK